MELTQLKRFVLVATLLNVHRAAEEAHVSQSALSLGLKNLEEELGFLLFERVGKRLVLTPEGKRFLEKVRPLIGELEEAKEWASRAPEDQREKVVVVAGSTTIDFLLPQVGDFLTAHPDIDLRLVTGWGEEVFRRLETGEADFAMGRYRYSFFPTFLDAQGIFSDWYVLILNTRSLLKLKRKPTLKDIAQLPLCLAGPPSLSSRDTIPVFAQEGLTPHVVLSTYSNWSVRQAVRYNPQWAGILSIRACRKEDQDRFRIFDLRHLFPSSEVLLVKRKTAFSTKGKILVYDFLRSLSVPQTGPGEAVP